MAFWSTLMVTGVSSKVDGSGSSIATGASFTSAMSIVATVLTYSP